MIEIPGYTMEKQLGRGGMARVYLARHIGLDRLVAIKVLSKDLDGDSSFSERFIREARIVASLSHPNIITVFDVGVHEQHHYIAMEYLPGETLDDKVKKGLSVAQIFSITKQIAAALDFAHKKGIVHRDVKPDNILFREDGSAVLTDFGIARAAKSETKMTATGTVIGTPHYMSPEQAQGQEIGAWSDLYSLGIVLFEMLKGEVPFDADSTIAVVFKHISEPVPDLNPEHQAYQPLINTLLAKKPEERYQSGREVIADIEALERGETPANATLIFKQTTLGQTAINPAVTTEQTTQNKAADSSEHRRKASRLPVILIAMTALAALAGGGYYYLQTNTGAPETRPGETASQPAGAEQQQLLLAQQEQAAREREAQRKQEELQAQLQATEQQQAKDAAEEAARAAELKRIREEKAEAEAEAKRAREELLALKKQQLAQQKKAREQAKKAQAQREQAKREQARREQVRQEKARQEKARLEKARLEKAHLEKAKQTPAQSTVAATASNTRTTPVNREYLNDLLQAADNALSRQRLASAEENYRRVLQQEPANRRAQAGMEKLQQIKNRQQTAAAGADPGYIADMLKAADNALAQNKLASAEQNYQRVLKVQPGNTRARQGMEKVRQLSAQRKANKGSSNAYLRDLLQAADNALQNDRLSSAAYNYEKVLQSDRDNAAARKGLELVFKRHLQLAVEEAKDDDPEDAREHIEAARKLKPGDARIRQTVSEVERVLQR